MKELEIGRYTVLLKKEIDDYHQETLDCLITAFAIDDGWILGVDIDELQGIVYIAAIRLLNRASWTLVFRLNKFNTVLKVEFECKSHGDIKSNSVEAVLDEIKEFYMLYINDKINWKK